VATSEVKARELTLDNVWVRKGLLCRLVMLMWTDQTKQTIRVWYQDPYTPPEAHKEDWLEAEAMVTIDLEAEVSEEVTT
jgi:hypothetical protein